MLVQPKTGEFVHPGEFDAWQRVRKQWARLEQERAEAERRRLEIQRRRERGDETAVGRGEAEAAREEESRPAQVEGVCILCGQVTTEWGFVSEMGKRICRECYEGRSR